MCITHKPFQETVQQVDVDGIPSNGPWLIHEWKNLGKMVTVEKIENLENPFPCRIAREKK